MTKSDWEQKIDTISQHLMDALGISSEIARASAKAGMAIPLNKKKFSAEEQLEIRFVERSYLQGGYGCVICRSDAPNYEESRFRLADYRDAQQARWEYDEYKYAGFLYPPDDRDRNHSVSEEIERLDESVFVDGKTADGIVDRLRSHPHLLASHVKGLSNANAIFRLTPAPLVRAIERTRLIFIYDAPTVIGVEALKFSAKIQGQLQESGVRLPKEFDLSIPFEVNHQAYVLTKHRLRNPWPGNTLYGLQIPGGEAVSRETYESQGWKLAEHPDLWIPPEPIRAGVLEEIRTNPQAVQARIETELDKIPIAQRMSIGRNWQAGIDAGRGPQAKKTDPSSTRSSGESYADRRRRDDDDAARRRYHATISNYVSGRDIFFRG